MGRRTLAEEYYARILKQIEFTVEQLNAVGQHVECDVQMIARPALWVELGQV